MSRVCQWGLYNWFDEHGLDLVHPDDVDAFRAFTPQGRLFHCVSEDANYLTLQHGESRFRVKPDLFTPVPPPRYHLGQQVPIRRGTNIVTVTICDIVWHFRKERPYYRVIVDGKRSGKQYWDEDFEVDGR